MATVRKYVYYILAFSIAALMFYFLYINRDKLLKVAVPFFMAAVLAYLLKPLVLRLEEKHIPRTGGIFILYALLILITGSILVFIIPELVNNTRDLINTLPEITGRYQDLFNNTMAVIQSSNWPADIKNTISREIQNSTVMAESFIIETLRKTLAYLVKTVTMLFDLILSMIIAYYIIKDSDTFKESFLFITPKKWRPYILSSGREINAILSNFIQGQLLTGLIVGLIEALGLFIVKVKYPFILGLIGGIANVIPYFGPIIGAIPAVAIALIDSPIKAGWTVVVFVVVQQVDNAFISPKIIEGRLGLHPVTTIFAVLIGGEFFGIMGMLLSVPVFAIIKVIIKKMVEAIV